MKKKDWKDPFYAYEIGIRRLRIVIDVTKSSRPFPNEVDCLSDVAAEFRDGQVNSVLDFGAGKLRNTLFLLDSGFTVYAVEFSKAFATPKAQERLKLAHHHTGFFFLEYPDDFLGFQGQLDAALLVNVVNIVPEPSERIKILRECAKRLKPGAPMLIMTQYGEPIYDAGATNRRKLKDGFCYNLDDKLKTFNRNYSIPQLHALVPSRYYTFDHDVRSKHHRALLFRRK